MERFLRIHGHFCQPPRENPWLESVEIQDSANSCHGRNERNVPAVLLVAAQRAI